MPEQLRVGIVGTSWWADSMYLPSLQSHPLAHIAAICGRNRGRADEMAQKYAVPRVFTDYRELIDRADVQALVVATPDDLHYPITMAALDAGLHVLCEKSMAFNVQQAREMLQKAEAAGVKHMVHFTWRWLPYIRYLLELIDAGYLGRCYDGHFRFAGGYGCQPRYQWKWDRRRGLGVLGDLGSHMIDLAHLCMGDVERVSATLSAFVERLGPDNQPLESANDSALLALQFSCGAHGTIHASAVNHLGDRAMELTAVLHGEKGTLELDVDFARGGEVRGAQQGEERLKPLPVPDRIMAGIDSHSPLGEQYDRIFREQSVGSRLFVDAILENCPLTPGFHDGLKVQQVIDAAFVAHKKKSWVSPLYRTKETGRGKGE